MVKHNISTYVILVLIFVVSATGAWLYQGAEVTKAFIALPGVVSLIGAVFQIARDEARYEKELELLRIQQTFSLGVASHMSNVVFDKHVEFCEKYATELDATVTTLFIEGPTDKALEHASELFKIRRDYSAWVTSDISRNLEPVESVIRKIGADNHFLKTTTGIPQYSEQRSKIIDQMYDAFSTVLNLDEKSGDSDEVATNSVESVKTEIRKILGTEQLTKLRQDLLQKAMSMEIGT